MKRIAALDDYMDQWRTLADWSPLAREVELVPFQDHIEGEDALAERLKGFDGVLLFRERTKLTETLLARLPKIEFIGTLGMMNRAIHWPTVGARRITVSGTPPNMFPVAELAWGLIFACARNLALGDRQIRNGQWGEKLGIELRGRTLGLMGIGRIGSDVLRMGAGFGMKRIAWSANVTQERCDAIGDVRAVTKDELLSQSEFLVIAVQGGPSTAGLIGARELGVMKPTACLINVSRAHCVDQKAMIAALQSGKLGSAGLDVYETEPLPADHPLAQLDNVVLSPHQGANTEGAARIAFQQMVENVQGWLAGKPLRQVGERGPIDRPWGGGGQARSGRG
jgi:phosphoglycerate dehydrogenase-like enzyme